VELGSSWDGGIGISRILLCWSGTEKDEVVRGREEGMKIRKGKKYRDRAIDLFRGEGD
jgi:hypothetical protein